MKNQLTASQTIDHYSLMLLTVSCVLPIRGLTLCLYAFFGIQVIKYFLSRRLIRAMPPVESHRQLALAFGLFSLTYAVSLIWTADVKEGLARLEARSLMLFIPLAFYSLKIQILSVKNLMVTFVYAVGSIIVICFAVALQYGLTHENDFITPFKYYNFGFMVGIHPSYLSFLLVLSLLFIYKTIFEKKENVVPLLLIGAFHIFSVLFIGARVAVGLLGVVVLFIFYDLARTRRMQNIRSFVSIIFIVIVLAFVGLAASKNATTRLRATSESFQDRIDLFTIAVDLISKRPLFGFGVGGDRQALIDEYRSRGLIDAAEQAYNAHNQYLQTMLEAGLIGLSTLIFILITTWRNLRMRPLSSAVLVLFLIFFLVEASLQRIQGVVVFVVMSVLLCSPDGNSQLNKPIAFDKESL